MAAYRFTEDERAQMRGDIDRLFENSTHAKRETQRAERLARQRAESEERERRQAEKEKSWKLHIERVRKAKLGD